MSDIDSLSRWELVSLVEQLHLAMRALQERVTALEEENRKLQARLSGGGGGAGSKAAPSWVKANRAERPKKERKKRDRPAFRRRDEPTQEQVHVPEVCPECGRKLCGGWEVRRRQVMEIPPTPVRIVDHVVMGRHCGVCGKDVVAPLDLCGEVVGQHRVGVGLMSLIALWREVARLPIRTIQSVLEAQYGLHLSVGELVEILHTVAERGSDAYAKILGEVRASEFVQADETGWREDGENGYLWSFSTPTLRYFTYAHSRGGDVAREVLCGEQTRTKEGTSSEQEPVGAFRNVLLSDFYSGYSWYLGEHQRCWVHLLRDLHDLKEKHPNEPSVAEWVKAVREVYEEAKIWVAEHPEVAPSVRRAQRFVYQAKIEELGKPYAGVEGVAQKVLAERLMRFAPELFTFVEYKGVPSENNAAERALRPSVIARKISGGTRSPKGSTTRCVLRTLFGTWQLQGRDLLDSCRQMLVGTLVPQAP